MMATPPGRQPAHLDIT